MPPIPHIPADSPSLPVNYELRTARHAFRIVRKIAAGGFGITYQAENLVEFVVPGTSQVVPAGALLAIKECYKRDIMVRAANGMSRPLMGAEGDVKKLREQFLNEAFTLLRLQQAYPAQLRADAALLGFVPLFHAGTATSRTDIVNVHYFVMPYLTGGSLREQAGRMRPEQVVWTTYRLLRALQLLHNDAKNSAPMLHRDIKPVNIMLTETGAPVLIDFGISSGTENQGGTLHYAPHEQLRRGKLGRYSDIYALGGTLYELVTGKRCEMYNKRPPYTTTDPYSPLATNVTLLNAYRACGKVFEKEFAQAMGKPYRDGHGNFAAAFLSGIDTALRTQETGPHGRWQSATQWLDFVFQGLSPKHTAPQTPAGGANAGKDDTRTVWVPNNGSAAKSRKAPLTGLEVLLRLTITVFIILVLAIAFIILTNLNIIQL